jgi:hypothetical protein
MPDPKSTLYAVAIGLILYFLLERPKLLGKHDESSILMGDDNENSVPSKS